MKYSGDENNNNTLIAAIYFVISIMRLSFSTRAKSIQPTERMINDANNLILRILKSTKKDE